VAESPARPATGGTASGPAPPVLRLAWQSGVYALGNLALKASGLLLLPLLLDPTLLSQADYGYLGLIETVAQLAIAVTGLGLASGLLRYTTTSAPRAERDAYTTTAFLTTALAASGTFAAIALLAEPLAEILVGDGARAGVVRWAGAYVALKVVGAVPYMVLRVRERAGLFLVALLAEIAVLVAGVWVALARYDAGLEGVMAAFAVAAGAATVPLSLVVLRGLRAGWRPVMARQLLRFGMPLTLAALAGILLNTGDRFVVEAFVGAEVLAVYVLAAKFGGLINMLFVQSFNMAFAVLGLKTVGAGEGTDFHRRVFRHFVVGAGWGVLGVSVLTRDVTAWLSPNPAYLEAEPLVLPIAFGFLLYGVYYVVINVLYAAERTRQVAGLVLVAAVFNLALNLALVPWLGAMGAALATVGAYGLLVGVSVRQARRAMPLVLPWRVLASTVLLVGGLWALAQPSADWETLPRLAARLGLIAAYPPLVMALGMYRWEEARALAARLRLGGG
jgi:O-antigen/teichoic acid export membrane protein